MKKIPMIIAIVVSIFSAQGVAGQDDDLASIEDGYDVWDYEYEQQEYTEINIVELPLSVQELAAKDYRNLRIVKAYMSKDNTYKIIFKDDNDNTKVVFASANGEWITPNDNKS
ncbi:hypothetical protein [Aquimarina algicola]|uniref:Uncharacterized protein n=1 Tax=Aquimarina algicola TaxID=2589995 RepID=A0A504JA97_9FLAO|nr:hypothetical protein [Aquimarina algicola]TPN87574.1 hypothetical protein FHK87_08310 [Aquimarina algicola]